MKIRILTFVLLLLFCLSSCTADALVVESFGNGKPSSPVMISAEILTRRVKKTEGFEIKVGIGQVMSHPNATLKISAPNLAIILSDGSRFEEEYTYEYSDFDAEKYGVSLVDNKTRLNYFETFRFEYIGTEDDYTGGISFWIHAMQNVEMTEEQTKQNFGVAGDVVAVYYRVRGENIKLTTKRLDISSQHHQLTTTAAD